ncbi:hypothetical protein ACIRU3_32295 [Streptomyces sp. NPDC101151]|uniref:hypothetical protein n=1 Tax=Streptomyces sp. NPDC101151 TaxID=3366115 RepID=UPI00381F6C0E
MRQGQYDTEFLDDYREKLFKQDRGAGESNTDDLWVRGYDATDLVFGDGNGRDPLEGLFDGLSHNPTSDDGRRDTVPLRRPGSGGDAARHVGEASCGGALGYQLLSSHRIRRWVLLLVFRRDDDPLARRRAGQTIERLRAGGPVLVDRELPQPPPPPAPAPPLTPRPPAPRPRRSMEPQPPPPLGPPGARIPPRPPAPTVPPDSPE